MFCEAAILWVASIAVFYCLTKRLWRSGRNWHASRLLKQEHGATYAMQVVVITPFFLFTIAFVTELTLMSIAKIGVTYASYSAARAASVWLPTDLPEATRNGMIHAGAVNALWTFASGSAKHALSSKAPGEASQASVDAYQSYSGGRLDADYLKRKYDYA